MDKLLPKLLRRGKQNTKKIKSLFNIKSNQIISTANAMRNPRENQKRQLTSIKSASRYLTDVINFQIQDERDVIIEQRKIEKPIYRKISSFSKKTRGTINLDTNIIGIQRTINQVLKKTNTDKFITIKIDGASYPLNLTNRLKLSTFMEDLDEFPDGISESDKAFFIKLIEENNIHVSYVDTNNQNLTNPSGAFFTYLNKTEFNLERYGVYKEVNPDNYKHNCLFIALQNGGLNDVKLNQLKHFVINREVAMCKLKDICNKLKIYITIERLDNHKQKYKYGDETNKHFKLGLINKHYFIIEKVDFTKYSLENYGFIKEAKDFKDIYKKRDNGYRRDKQRHIDSFKAIKFMYQNKEDYLIPIAFDSNVFATQYHSEIQDEDFLGYGEDEIKLNEYDAEKIKKADSKYLNRLKIWFDFETYKENIEGKDLCVPFMVCWRTSDNKKGFALGKNCGRIMLDKIASYSKPNDDVLLIAHNSGFDYNFIVKYLYSIEQIKKGSCLMNAKAKYKSYKNKTTINIEVKDSYRLITMPLRSFGKCFNLKIEKDVMPYDLYNEEVCKGKPVDIKEVKKYLNEKDFKQFKKNCEENNCMVDKKRFDAMKYALYYCRKDVEVLYQGYTTFRIWMLEITQIDINRKWTIASLSDEYLKKRGVYDGVYQLSGGVRSYIQKCVVGGRTMCRDNVKHKIEGKKMADYDGVSLYPSAMSRMTNELGGVLIGKPKVLKNLNYNWLKNNTDGYFIKIKINSIGTKRHFSLISSVNENGVRIFSNDVVGKVYYVDRTTLEDWKKFHNITFDIINGYYYDDGRNEKIGEVLEYLFNERLRKKKEKNPIQVIYKLIMNSSYGKSILKPINKESKVLSNEKELNNFIQKNYNFIIQYEKIYNSSKYYVEFHKSINEHFNNASVGVEILSMSKRIMNEVMCLAEDEDLTAYYQDTDSIHMLYDEVEILKEKFNLKYNKELDGKQLGQFHIDFDLHDKDGNECKNVYADKSIFLGKKCYIDCLKGTNPEGKIVSGFHTRMKGIPESTIIYTAKQLNINLYELYEKLYDGNKINFDLLEGGKRCNMKFNNNLSVSYLNDFKRELCF